MTQSDHTAAVSSPSRSPSKSKSKPVYGTPEEFARAIEELRTLFAEGAVTTAKDQLEAHGFSPNAHHPGCPHSVVVYPSSTEDVVKIVNVARKYRMPVIPYSGGTSLEGHFAGWKSGGICIDMSGMDKIIAIHEEDSDLVCQSGVGWMEINETLKEKGIPLFFPLDPGPTATIGGMLSTGCSGTNAVRYGTAKGEWFLNATVVLPSGEVIKTRRRSRKSSAGFDTTKLFIGAEGTLGIVTEVTIRLAPVIPTTVATARFPNVRKASEAVIEILNTGIGIQCIELVDAEFMRATVTAGNPARPYDIADHLFFKLQGATPGALAESVDIVKTIVKKHGGDKFWPAKNNEEAEAVWTDRKNGLYSFLAFAGEGAKVWSTDVCVPISKLPQLVYETQHDIKQTGLWCSVIGHAGDGNFHTCLTFKTDEELAIVRGLVHRMVERALALDGTCTGEHGVGIGKKEFLVEELGAGTVSLMKTIKQAIDPLGIMNPGKVCGILAKKKIRDIEGFF
ncbi:FAD-linked oxidase-like protein [Multifurca ochricompacta]|uniref:D-lactate dehydrogenase (cytochrome) n=1 Tax=Multifurca ochricompacta TaxID=376703 RepID=A0AAD4M329_9AGAM|nr:FAD-linked oxidase-like protein [Multifurca ochricompacta]